ncbi:hypothetical protein H1235_11695 [Pseudoxanthomonas sp. NC8]|nr:hypothetical protein H1235_11695 [Pseudoxanthomonas sp. NC8]
MLCTFFFTLGFGACAIGFGVPAIAEALEREVTANWVAAIATFIAAAIALALGLIPILDTENIRRRRSKALSYITYSRVDTEVGFVRAAQILFERCPDDVHYNTAMGFALRADSEIFDGLVAAFDCIPEEVTVAIAHVVSEIERFRQITAPKGTPLIAPDDFITLPPLDQVMQPMVDALLDVRTVLFQHAAGREPPPLEVGAKKVAEKLEAGLQEVLAEHRSGARREDDPGHT